MTDEEMELIVDGLMESVDDAIADLPLSEAIEVVEYLHSAISGRLGGLYSDRDR
jgi:hypothetical protein